MKLGILGAGGIASTMAKTVAGMKDVEAYAVAARDLGRAQVFAQKSCIRMILRRNFRVFCEQEQKH